MIDALTVRALGAELQGTIAGGRVQNLFFIAPEVIGLEVYAKHTRHYLLASAERERARLLLVTEKLRSASVSLTPFLLLLKKYVSGSFINRINVVARERILHIEFDQRENGVSTLVVELVGNRANLILLDAGGNILDALRRVPTSESRARAIVPRAKYLPPPPQIKADPLALDEPQFRAILEKAKGETLAERLVAGIAATSPLFARELAFRVSGNTNSLYTSAYVAQTFTELTRVWRSTATPALAFETQQPIAVAAFLLTQFTQFDEIPSMSAALEKFYGAEESYQAVKVPLRAQIVAALEKLERVRASLQRELISRAEIEDLKLKGDMILGYQHTLTPGQTKLHAHVTEDSALDIALDPNLSPVENANAYYEKYKRARDAQLRVPERLAVVENDILFAQQALNDLELAETRAEIDQIAEQASQANLIREAGARAAKNVAPSAPRQFVSPDGLQILVGRNARQNDALTFERAKPDDVWLHARGHAGSHVILLSNGANVSQATIEFAASLAAYFSQARSNGAVDVIYTARKNVQRVRGAGAHPGLVTVKQENVVRVKPAAHSEEAN